MKAFAQLWFRVAFPVFAALFAQPAAAGNYHVTIADGCAGSSLCLAPNPLVIHAGSTVEFAVYCGGFDYFYDDYACTTPGTQRHNIVADDGSFRCARGCDGDGGDGTPAVNDGGWGFTRIFHAPGMVRYHDESSGASGLIVVLGGPGPLVVEFFNPDLGNYFITSDVGEQALVDAGGAGNWQRTGKAFKSGGPDKVCRFTGNPTYIGRAKRPLGPNSHFYTADAQECTNLRNAFNLFAPGWLFESEDFSTLAAGDRGCPENVTPIYRAYNNGFARGIDSNHRFTADAATYQSMLAAGWIGEGVVMCAPQ